MTSWNDGGKQFDVIVDTVGGGNFYGRAEQVLKPGKQGGKFVAVTGDDPRPDCRTVWKAIKFFANMPLRPLYTKIKSPMNNLVASTIVVGFSFDYALHFGCCYMASSGNAEERVKASISHLWVTLVNSAITTGASVVLQLTLGVPFFVIVGGMIIITLFVSLLYTLLFLSSLCILFSPGVKSNEPLRALDAAGYMEEEPTLDEQQVMQELESR